MSDPDRKRAGRREFLRAAGRGAFGAAAVAVGAILGFRWLRSSPDRRCERRSPCAECGQFDMCALARAKAARATEREKRRLGR